MRKTDSFVETILVPHVPSSSWMLDSVTIVIIYLITCLSRCLHRKADRPNPTFWHHKECITAQLSLSHDSTSSVFSGAYAAKLIDETQRFDITRNACPGAGACGGMYTANTMSSAIEAMGMSLPYSSSVPAEDPLKKLECRLAGRQVLLLLLLLLWP